MNTYIFTEQATAKRIGVINANSIEEATKLAFINLRLAAYVFTVQIISEY